jgi:CelD/BcsL family acetyltransferase involved in cellulose biosynthesis
MQLAIETQGRYWLFKIGFDDAYAKCSPGTLLMLHTLGYAARAGLAAYEMMGEVEPWIADFWTQEAHPVSMCAPIRPMCKARWPWRRTAPCGCGKGGRAGDDLAGAAA